MRITNKTIIIGSIFLILVVTFISLMRTSQKNDLVQYMISQTAQDANDPINYDYTEIAADVIRRKMRTKPKSVVIIDIRPSTQFTHEHIVNSLSFPIDKLIDGNIAPNYNADMVVVAFDTLNANLISQAVKILEKQNAYVVALSGGIQAWRNSGGAMISAGDPHSIVDVAKIHPLSQDDLLAIIAAKRAGTDYKYVILDIRPRAQFDHGHIPYAINLPLTDLEHNAHVLPATKTIIVYGATAIDSFRGGVQLYDLNFTTAKTLDGGYIDWVRNNHETIKNKNAESSKNHH